MTPSAGQANRKANTKLLKVVLGCLLAASFGYGISFIDSHLRSSSAVQAASESERVTATNDEPRFRVEAETLLSGTIEVQPGTYYQVKFVVPQGAVEPKISGSFRARGGSGNDIKVVVGRTRGFENWINGHTAPMAYASGKLTADELRVPLSPGEEYVLALDNSYSTFSSKSVETSLYLVYQLAARSHDATLGDLWRDSARR